MTLQDTSALMRSYDLRLDLSEDPDPPYDLALNGELPPPGPAGAGAGTYIYGLVVKPSR